MYADAIKTKEKTIRDNKKNNLKSLNAFFGLSSLQQDYTYM
jgi:hypothetical protein